MIAPARESRALLAEWRKHDNLTKAQVAERMGVTPPVISRLENNITKVSIDTLTRYAHACGIKKNVIALYWGPLSGDLTSKAGTIGINAARLDWLLRRFKRFYQGIKYDVLERH